MNIWEERERRHWDFWADFWSRLRPGKIIRTVSMKQTVPLKIDGKIVGTAEVDLETGMATCRFDEGKKPAALTDYQHLGVSIGDKDAVIFRENSTESE
mgnify:CR=1 FL=1